MKQLAFLIILLLGTLDSFLTSETPGQMRHDKETDNCTYTITKPSSGISKNGTLKPSDHCEWNVFGNDSHIGSSGLLFEKVHLEVEDSLTIKDSEGNVIFGPYNGTQGPLVIAVDEKNFTVVLNVSNKKGTRAFQILYSENCVFNIPPSIDMIESPIYRVRPKLISCTYDYKTVVENITHSFVFKSFNLDSKSQLEVSETGEPQDHVYKKTPPDIFSPVARFNMTLNINSTGNNVTIMRRNVFKACSGYLELSTTPVTVLSSPPAMTLSDDNIYFECRWLVKNTVPNSVLKLGIDKLQFSNVFDMLTINNGKSELSPPLVQAALINQEETKAQAIISSGEYLWISFKSEAFASNFSGNCSEAKGGYYTSSGTISAQSGAEFLLEVGKTEKVLLNFSSSDLASPATLNIYDGFDTVSAPIAQLSGNVWYPVVSGTSKMMVVAKNLDASKTFTAHFSGIKSDCIHMSALVDDTYVLAGNCNMTCVWVVPPKTASGQVLVLEFHLLSLDASDVIEVFRLNDNKTPVASVLHSTKYVPPLTFDPAEGFYMNVSRGMCKSEEVVLVAHATYLPGCSRNFSLAPSNELQLSSPNYPNMYPLLASCEWNFKASGNRTQFYLAFESINLAPGHSIQINHTVAGVTKTEVISGNQLPSDLLLQNVVISFNSSQSSREVSLVSGEGFVLNVTSSDCGSVMRNKTGQFNTSLAVSKVPSSCFWIIEVPHSEADGSVNSVMFTVEVEDVKNNNSEFHIYDGSSVRQPLLTNYTGYIWSRNNTVIFVYKRFNSSVSSNVYKVNYQTINCNKTSQCDNGICLHPDWRCNEVNDCGDFTDEKDCQTVPVPKPEKETDNKISAVTFGVVTVLFFILGALAAFLIPKAINRYRSGRYHQFQDYSNVD